MDHQNEAEELKRKGNEEFKKQNLEKAIEHYSRAIELDPASHVLYSNRCACHIIQKNWTTAEADALRCIELCNSFTKGYFRLSSALLGQQRRADAVTALQTALALNPEDGDIAIKLDGIQAELAKEELQALPAEDLDSTLRLWARKLLTRHAHDRIMNLQVELSGQLSFFGDDEEVLYQVEDTVTDDTLYRNFVNCIPALAVVYNAYSVATLRSWSDHRTARLAGIYIMLSKHIAISPFLSQLIFLENVECDPFDIISVGDDVAVVAKMSISLGSKLMRLSFWPTELAAARRQVLIPRTACATLSSKLVDDVIHRGIFLFFRVRVFSDKKKKFELFLDSGQNTYRTAYDVDFTTSGSRNQLSVNGHVYSDCTVVYDDWIQYDKAFSAHWDGVGAAVKTEWVEVPGTYSSGTPRYDDLGGYY